MFINSKQKISNALSTHCEATSPATATVAVAVAAATVKQQYQQQQQLQKQHIQPYLANLTV